MADSGNPANDTARRYLARLSSGEKLSAGELLEIVQFLKKQDDIKDEPAPSIAADHPALQRIEKPIPAVHAAALLDTTEDALDALVRSLFLDLPRLRIASVWHYSPEGLRYILMRRKALAIATDQYH